jgi:hypothetical protein
MRVHLIRPMIVAIRQLDTAATRAQGGYDSEFGAINVGVDAAGRRVVERAEGPELRLRGQIEDQTMNALRMFNAGNSPEAKLAVTFSYRDLEDRGLVNPVSKQPSLNVNDRLVAIYSPAGELVLRLRDGGLYAVEVRPAGLALGGGVGIVVVRFNDRALSEAPA